MIFPKVVFAERFVLSHAEYGQPLMSSMQSLLRSATFLTRKFGNLFAIHYVADEISLSIGMNFVQVSLVRGLCRELLDAFTQVAFEDQIGLRPIYVFSRLTFDGG